MSDIKYPWALAPDWAEYAATDNDGDEYWYELKPEYDAEYMWISTGRCQKINQLAVHAASTLQKRPQS